MNHISVGGELRRERGIVTLAKRLTHLEMDSIEHQREQNPALINFIQHSLT